MKDESTPSPNVQRPTPNAMPEGSRLSPDPSAQGMNPPPRGLRPKSEPPAFSNAAVDLLLPLWMMGRPSLLCRVWLLAVFFLLPPSSFLLCQAQVSLDDVKALEKQNQARPGAPKAVPAHDTSRFDPRAMQLLDQMAAAYSHLTALDQHTE